MDLNLGEAKLKDNFIFFEDGQLLVYLQTRT